MKKFLMVFSAIIFILGVAVSKAVFTQFNANEAAIPSFKDQCIKWHNIYREKHQVGSVTWDDTLARGAQSWAKYLAENNTFKHASGIQPGENLYLSGSPLPEEPCTEATQLFYGKIKDYDFNKPGFSKSTGHFTQVVWKKTKKIGAAQQTRRDGRLVVVIRYSPAGNYVTEKAFRENVLPARSGNGIGQIHSCSALTAFLVAFGAVLKFLF